MQAVILAVVDIDTFLDTQHTKLGEIPGVSARIFRDLLQVSLQEVETGVLVSLYGSSTTCSLPTLRVFSTHLILDFAQELDDLFNSHTDAIVAFSEIASVVIETLRNVCVRFEECEGDLWMRLEDLLAICINPLLRAT